MSDSKRTELEKFDELLKETKAANRVATWQLVVSLAALIPGVVVAASQLGSTAVIAAFVLPIGLVAAFFAAYPSGSSSGGQWYAWTEARERLRLLDDYMGEEFGKHAATGLYLSALRMHYQFALVEGRKELAEYLKQEIEKATTTSPKAH